MFCIWYDFGRGGDGVLAAGGHVAAEPAGTAAFDTFEEDVGLALQSEADAGLQAVEGDMLLGTVVGVVVAQQFFYLSHQVAVEGHASYQTTQQRLYFGREEGGVADEKLGIFGLPFVAVGLHVAVFQMGLKVGGFVEKHPQEEIGVQVAVDAYLMVIMVLLGPSVVAQFGTALTGDMEVHTMAVQVVIDRSDCLGRKVIPQNATVFLFGGQNVGQSQWLRLWRYMWSLDLHDAQSSRAASSRKRIPMFFLALGRFVFISWHVGR